MQTIYRKLKIINYNFSLGYITEHMDSDNDLPPLLGVKLTLTEIDMVLSCQPPLDSSQEGCFTNIVEGLIKDIIHMATLIPRVSLWKSENYLVSLFLLLLF